MARNTSLSNVPDDVIRWLSGNATNPSDRRNASREVARRAAEAQQAPTNPIARWFAEQAASRRRASERVEQAGGFFGDLAQRNAGGLLNRLTGIFGPVPTPLTGGQPLPLPTQLPGGQAFANLPAPGAEPFSRLNLPPSPFARTPGQRLAQRSVGGAVDFDAFRSLFAANPDKDFSGFSTKPARILINRAQRRRVGRNAGVLNN